MKKTFVSDTNVPIHDPTSLFKFDNNDIVIPFFPELHVLYKLTFSPKYQHCKKSSPKRMQRSFTEAISYIGIGGPFDTFKAKPLRFLLVRCRPRVIKIPIMQFSRISQKDID